MRNVRDHILASAGVLLLLQTVQIAFESVAAAFVYRGQILPAYGFFPTQLYDFVVKIRWAAEPYAAWLPGLPQDFREPSALGHLAVVLDLLPAGIATALFVGVLGGLAGALVFGRRTANVRSYLALWAAVGLIVHIIDPTTGDVNGDSVLDAQDIDDITLAVRAMPSRRVVTRKDPARPSPPCRSLRVPV